MVTNCRHVCCRACDNGHFPGLPFDAGAGVTGYGSLEADRGGSLLTLRHEQLFAVSARDAHERAWIGTLDKLEAVFA